MKIEKSNFRGLHKTLINRRFELHFDKKPEFYDNIKGEVQRIVDSAKIQYITQPVLEAVDFCDKKTVSKLLDLRSQVASTYKCFIYKSANCYQTDFVTFDKQETITTFMIFGYMDMKHSPEVSYFTTGYFNHADKHNKYQVADFSYVHSPSASALDLARKNQFVLSKIELAIQFEVFLQYAEIETKLLKPYHKDVDGVACRYENKMQYPIEIINSTWFTNLVKSDAFKVRGHFRLQPYGHGLKDRKLIWINEFQKEGYIREAKILSQHPETAGTNGKVTL